MCYLLEIVKYFVLKIRKFELNPAHMDGVGTVSLEQLKRKKKSPTRLHPCLVPLQPPIKYSNVSEFLPPPNSSPLDHFSLTTSP